MLSVMLVLHAQLRHQGLATAVFGHEPDPGVDRRLRVVDRYLRARDGHATAVVGIDAENASGELAPPCADQAGMSDDLAFADIEGDVGEHAATRTDP